MGQFSVCLDPNFEQILNLKWEICNSCCSTTYGLFENCVEN